MSISFFKEHQSTLDIVSTYSDIFGRHQKVSESIDVTQFVKQLERVRVRYEEDDLKSIRRELEKIARQLDQRHLPPLV